MVPLACRGDIQLILWFKPPSHGQSDCCHGLSVCNHGLSVCSHWLSVHSHWLSGHSQAIPTASPTLLSWSHKAWTFCRRCFHKSFTYVAFKRCDIGLLCFAVTWALGKPSNANYVNSSTLRNQGNFQKQPTKIMRADACEKLSKTGYSKSSTLRNRGTFTSKLYEFKHADESLSRAPYAKSSTLQHRVNPRQRRNSSQAGSGSLGTLRSRPFEPQHSEDSSRTPCANSDS